jgi:hypothetical protein
MGLDLDNSPPSRVKIKNEWSYTYISASVFMACAGTILPFCGNPASYSTGPGFGSQTVGRFS